MAPLYEIPPTHCPACGERWVANRYLVGWANQRETPCRMYTCRHCDHRVYRERF